MLPAAHVMYHGTTAYPVLAAGFCCPHRDLEEKLRNAERELEVSKRISEQYERRATHLTRKHNAVDKAIHEQLQADHEAALQQLATAQQDVAAGQQQVAAAQQQVAAVQQALSSSNEQVSALQQQLRDNQQMVEAAQRQLQAMQRQQEAAKQQLAAAQSAAQASAEVGTCLVGGGCNTGSLEQQLRCC